MTIFQETCELEEGERSEFLEKASRDYPDLRSHIEQLLTQKGNLSLEFLLDPAKGESDQGITAFSTPRPTIFGEGVGISLDSGLFFQEHGEHQASDQDVSKPTASTKDRYFYKSEIARGGMGVVLKVWDRILHRNLAMKVILGKGGPKREAGSPVATSNQLSRFLEEAQITAQLDHPGIVPVHELGFDRDGRVYFTMRFVKGRELEKIFALARREEESWNLPRAIAVMVRVCQTVAYAHDKGIVHRDLKPANVMVGRFGEVYVMDWGLSKILVNRESHDLDSELKTQDSITIVSSPYRDARDDGPFSPIKTADGTVAGTPTYMSPEQARGDVREVGIQSDVYSLGTLLYTLLTGTTPYLPPDGSMLSPQAILGLVIAGAPRPVYDVNPKAPPELVAICNKAMSRRKPDRYASSVDMAEDLQAYLDNRVVLAYETGALAEIRKFVARNKVVAIAAAAVVCLGLFAGFGHLKVQENARNDALRQSYTANIIAADLSLRSNEVLEAKSRLAACDKELYGWEWEHLSFKSDSSLLTLRQGEKINCVAVSPAGTSVLAGSESGTILAWDLTENPLEARTLWELEAPINFLAFSGDGERIVSLSESTVQIWEPSSSDPLLTLPEDDALTHCVAISPDGRQLVTGSSDGHVRSWNIHNEPLESRLLFKYALTVTSVAFSPDGRKIVSASEDDTIRIFDAKSSGLLVVLPGKATSVAFNHDGTRVVSASEDKTVRVRNAVDDLTKPKLLLGHDAPVTSVAFSPDGKVVATASGDKTVRVWDSESGLPLAVLQGHEQAVRSVSFHPDGAQIVTGSADGTIRLWNVASSAAILMLHGPDDHISSIAVSRDGRKIVAGTRWTGAIRVWELDVGSVLLDIPGQDAAINSVALSPDRLKIASGGEDSTIAIWSSDSGELIGGPLEGHDASITSVAFSPDGSYIVSGSTDLSLRIWNVDLGAPVRWLHGRRGEILAVAFSPDGRFIASGSTDATVQMWNPQVSEEPVRVLSGHSAPVQCVAFSPDGSRIVSGSTDRTICVWSTLTGGKPIHILSGHEAVVQSVAYSPDGSRIVSGSTDRTFRVWNAASGKSLLTLRGHEGPVTAVTFSPDGSAIVSAAFDNTVRVWRTGARWRRSENKSKK